jgi:hypothetical protein
MTETPILAMLALAIVPVLLLLALVLNGPRAWRWERRARSHGKITCRSCGYVGALTIGCKSVSTEGSSSNLQLVCANCNSPDWRQTGS